MSKISINVIKCDNCGKDTYSNPDLGFTSMRIGGARIIGEGKPKVKYAKPSGKHYCDKCVASHQFTISLTPIAETEESAEVEAPKRKPGRPRKNPLPTQEKKEKDLQPRIRRGPGRPRKNPIPTPSVPSTPEQNTSIQAASQDHDTRKPDLLDLKIRQAMRS